MPDDVGGFSYTAGGWWHDPKNEAFTLIGELTRQASAEDCPAIAALVADVPLVEGATERWFFKESGTHSAFGEITSEYAFDMTLVDIPGSESPVPVKANGRLIMTVVATGDTIYWEQETEFTLEGVFFEAKILRGTGSLEGISGSGNGTAIPDEIGGFSYTANGWSRSR